MTTTDETDHEAEPSPASHAPSGSVAAAPPRQTTQAPPDAPESIVGQAAWDGLRREQSRRFFKLLVLADAERLLPSAELLDELHTAGLDEVCDRFAALAARLVELRGAILREAN